MISASLDLMKRSGIPEALTRKPGFHFFFPVYLKIIHYETLTKSKMGRVIKALLGSVENRNLSLYF